MSNAVGDGVWGPGGVCEGYAWDEYYPLVLKPGEVFTLTFQATAELSETGSYYNECLVRLYDWPDDTDWIYCWLAAEVTVPGFNFQSSTTAVVLNTHADIVGGVIVIESWAWELHN